MKKWLKKYGRWVIVGVGVGFVATSTWWIFTATEEWKIILYTIGATLWLVIILIYSGVIEKLYNWWEKD